MIKKEDYNKYYERGEFLGQAPFCSIYEGKKKKDEKSKDVKALKIFEKYSVEAYLRSLGIDPTPKEIEKYFKIFKKEANNMKILQENKENKNAVFIDDCFLTENEFVIIMEKCDNNLFKHLICIKKTSFNPDEIYEILKQLNNSFEIMVNYKIIHRALKPQNILLKYLNEEKSKFLVKLKITYDSCSLKDSSNLISLSMDKNNLKFASPEILKEDKNLEKSDLFSLGILIYFLSFKDYPFKGKNETEILQDIKTVIEGGNLTKINDPNLDDLMFQLLKIDPNERITWDDYFNHSFFIDNYRNNYENFYQKLEKISRIGYNSVYKAKKKDTGEIRALKIISKDSFNTIDLFTKENSKTIFKNFKNEIKNMIVAEGIKKDNQNTVELYEYFDMRNEFVIVMELCDKSLRNILEEKKKNKKEFEIKEILEILLQLNNTFKILVKNKMAHRDLKLDNILLKKNEKGQNIWKLIDYGVSKQLLTLKMEYTSFVGTMGYIAPEIIQGKPYTNKCDLWSLGIIIYNLCFQELPYNVQAYNAMMNQINNIGQKNFKRTGDAYLDDLINKLLVVNPDKRISWEEYFEHPFFKPKKNKNNI